MLTFRAGAALAVATSVIAVVTGVGSCAPKHPVTVSAPAGVATTTPTAPSPTSPASAATANLPIYYVGPTAAGPALYREYHRVAVGDGSMAAKVRAAVTLMLGSHTAADNDYTTPWPAGTTVRSVATSGSVTTIDLHGATGGAANAYPLALKQLIWTVTAVSGGTGVRLRFDGATRPTLGSVPVGTTLRRGPAVDALAPVWVIDPQAKATTGGAVTVHLAGIVFEGTINLRVRDSSGAIIKHQVVQLTVGAPAQGTATVHLSLAPGSYTIEAYAVSAKDSSIVALDGHPFTVK